VQTRESADLARVKVSDMSDNVTAQREIAATPERVWALISDVTRMGEFSPENVGCEWIGDRVSLSWVRAFGGRTATASDSGRRRVASFNPSPLASFAFEVKAAGLRVGAVGVSNRSDRR